jgi:hypothetical protein
MGYERIQIKCWRANEFPFMREKSTWEEELNFTVY